MEESLGCPFYLPLLGKSLSKSLDITDAEGDDDQRYLCWCKAELEKHIWMIAAELGQAPGL